MIRADCAEEDSTEVMRSSWVTQKAENTENARKYGKNPQMSPEFRAFSVFFAWLGGRVAGLLGCWAAGLPGGWVAGRSSGRVAGLPGGWVDGGQVGRWAGAQQYSVVAKRCEDRASPRIRLLLGAVC